MLIEQGNSLLETRRRNRVLIKNRIFREDHALRTDIARELELTLPTITTSINEMIKEGIVVSEPLPKELLNKTTGRRPTAVAFNRAAGYAVGIELGPYHTRAVLANLRGEVVESITDEAASDTYNQMLSQIEQMISHLQHRIPKGKWLGIGVGIPGFVDTDAGIIRQNFREDWNGKNLREDIQAAFHVPVCIDNNVRFRAIGCEMMMKQGHPRMFAYLFISRGIACPVIMNDLVLSGGNAGAGEVGAQIVMKNGDGMAPAFLTLDELGSEWAIFQLCEKEKQEGHLSVLDDKTSYTMRDILQLQIDGNEIVDKIMDQCIHYQAIAMANVVNLLNPNEVIVDAYMMSYMPNRDRLMRYARQYFYGINEKDVEIRFRDYDSYDGAIGAALGCIQINFLNI